MVCAVIMAGEYQSKEGVIRRQMGEISIPGTEFVL